MLYASGDLNQKENLETLELAKKYLVEDGGVVAIDLAGARGPSFFPTENYEDAFAKQENIRFHLPSTGEAGNAEGCKNSCPYVGAKSGS